MPNETPKKPGQKPAGKPAATKKTPPLSKEDAIRRLVENDPEKAAAILRSILKK